MLNFGEESTNISICCFCRIYDGSLPHTVCDFFLSLIHLWLGIGYFLRLMNFYTYGYCKFGLYIHAKCQLREISLLTSEHHRYFSLWRELYYYFHWGKSLSTALVGVSILISFLNLDCMAFSASTSCYSCASRI